MNKYKKNQKQGIIKLGKGYGLIVPEHSDTLELMTSCGVLISMLAQADKDNGVSKEKFKEMMNRYIDAIYSGDKDYLKEQIDNAKGKVQ
jgi:hypothetical protein